MSEFTYSATAVALGIDNTPSTIAKKRIKDLVLYVLQPLRDIEDGGINITSGIRTRETNEAIDGAANSKHLLGYAADIVTKNVEQTFYNLIVNDLPYTKAYLEIKNGKKWIHVEHDPRVDWDMRTHKVLNFDKVRIRFYVAGPISGVPNYKTNFKDAVNRLRFVFNTIESYGDNVYEGHPVMVIDPTTLEGLEGLPYNVIMKEDIRLMMQCSHVLFLEGWELSKGANIEHDLADKLGYNILYEKWIKSQ